MKTSPLLIALALQATPLCATEQIVTLGDSLTFAYEAEFGFQVSGSFGTVGDNMPSTVRNWIEILSDPAYRGDRFELGSRSDITVDPPSPFPDPNFDVYFRQSGNWAIPGLKVDELRRFITGDPAAGFETFISGSSNLALLFSNSDANSKFQLTDLENQITNTAERLTLFIGGNDVKTVYGTIYNGGSAGTFVADFIADITAILDRVQTLNPNIQIVLVNVPHIGITLDVKQDYPYNAVNTERVSAVMRDLNGQLAALASARNIGFADIYAPTLRMLDTTKLCIHGINFETSNGTETGALGQVWLNGPISDNFHPNTNAQSVIANEIIHGFNRRYNTGIPLLTATEMLVGLSGKLAGELDISYTTWMNKFIPTGPTRPMLEDSEGDGLTNGTEFALGLNPTVRDSDHVLSRRVGAEFELAYPTRLPSSTRYSLAPESSATLNSPFTPFTPSAVEADGLIHARIPIGATPGFIRLKASTLP
jgi:lysophospholipase L1-like esterase